MECTSVDNVGMYYCKRNHLQQNVLKTLGLSSKYEIINNISQSISRIDIDKHVHNFVLTGNDGGTISLYNFANKIDGGKFYPIKRMQAHDSIITHVQWYPADNGAFISSSLDGSLLVWDASSLCTAGAFEVEDKIFCAQMRVDAAHNMIAVGTNKPDVRLCDLNSGSFCQVLRHGSPVYALDWSPQGAHILATGTMDGSVKVWDIRQSGYGPLISFDWQQDHTLAKRSFTGQGLNSFHFQSNSRSFEVVTRAHVASILSIKYSTCGNYLLTIGKDKLIRRWSSHDGYLYDNQYDVECLKANLPYQTEIVRIGNTSEYDILMVPDNNKNVVMQDVHSNSSKPFHILKGHMNAVKSIAYRNNSMYQVLSGSTDGMILVWDMESQSTAYQEKYMNKMKKLEEIESARLHPTVTTLERNHPTPGIKNSIVLDDTWSDEEEEENIQEASNKKGRGPSSSSSSTSQLLISQDGLLVSRYGASTTTSALSSSSDIQLVGRKADNNNTSTLSFSSSISEMQLFQEISNLPNYRFPSSPTNATNATIPTTNTHRNTSNNNISETILRNTNTNLIQNMNKRKLIIDPNLCSRIQLAQKKAKSEKTNFILKMKAKLNL